MIQNNKSTILLIIFAGILLLIVVIISIISITASPKSQQTLVSPTPVPQPGTNFPGQNNSPTSVPTTIPVTLAPTTEVSPTVSFDENKTTNPPVTYDSTAQASLMDKIQNRKPLSSQDALVKERMLSSLNNAENSGILYESPTVSISYWSAPDVFQVEILTTNIDQAKKEGNNWFLTQGFSQDAICTYPVEFYLNFDIAQQLRGQNITFNPLAPGCQ